MIPVAGSGSGNCTGKSAARVTWSRSRGKGNEVLIEPGLHNFRLFFMTLVSSNLDSQRFCELLSSL